MRTELGLTQADVADRAKVSVNYISELERGLRNPSILTLHRIATAGLGIEADALLAPAARPGDDRATRRMASYPPAIEAGGDASVATDASRSSTTRKVERRLASLLAGAPASRRRKLRALFHVIAEFLK